MLDIFNDAKARLHLRELYQKANNDLSSVDFHAFRTPSLSPGSTPEECTDQEFISARKYARFSKLQTQLSNVLRESKVRIADDFEYDLSIVVNSSLHDVLSEISVLDIKRSEGCCLYDFVIFVNFVVL